MQGMNLGETPASSSQGTDLIMAIKKAFPDASMIPSEIREALDKSEVVVTKDLHRATSALGKAQKSVRELEEAKDRHRTQWLGHMKESLTSWQQQMQAYDEQQCNFTAAINKARTEMDQAHQSIQVLNARAAGKTPPEPPPVKKEELGAPTGEDDQEERDLRKQVHQMVALCALQVSEKTHT